MPGLAWSVAIDRFATDGAFSISRGSRTQAVVVVASVTDGRHTGRGEATPYARYGETVDGVAAIIRDTAPTIADRHQLAQVLPVGAARNAMDCALWDLEAKRRAMPVHAIIGRAVPAPLLTAFTISLAAASEMAAKAVEHADKPLLKIKLGSPDDVERLAAIRASRPDARIIVDANEGWSGDNLPHMLAAAAHHRVELIEQPVPAGQDALLRGMSRAVPLCADESVHTRDRLAELRDLYDADNIKLDKTGGLTEALALYDSARALGFRIMVGCMLSSSLAMAPAAIVAQDADWCDLDAPLLLAEDRDDGVAYQGAWLQPPPQRLWG